MHLLVTHAHPPLHPGQCNAHQLVVGDHAWRRCCAHPHPSPPFLALSYPPRRLLAVRRVVKAGGGGGGHHSYAAQCASGSAASQSACPLLAQGRTKPPAPSLPPANDPPLLACDSCARSSSGLRLLSMACTPLVTSRCRCCPGSSSNTSPRTETGQSQDLWWDGTWKARQRRRGTARMRQGGGGNPWHVLWRLPHGFFIVSNKADSNLCAVHE